MIPATNDSLARAIDYLGAVEVAPGHYAWFDESQNGYRIASNIEQYRPDEEEGYATFCEAVNPVEMPAWWTPEQRFAWRVTGYGYDLSVRYRTQGEALAAPCDYPQTFDGTGQPKRTARRITADLETGKEILA